MLRDGLLDMGGYEAERGGGVGDALSQERTGLREDWKNAMISTWLLYMGLGDPLYDEQMPKEYCPSSSITEPTSTCFQSWRECVLPANTSAPDDPSTEDSYIRILLQLPEPCAPLS